MEHLLTVENLIALVTLTSLEIILGMDNIVFLAIVVQKLPAEQQDKARKLGLTLALGTRILLLLSLSWVMQLTTPLFHIWSYGISGRSLILIMGGLFLLAKSTHEIHDKIEGGDEGRGRPVKKMSFTSALIQIALLDIIFSLDSVITAVGMANEILIMIAAVVLAMGVMLAFAKPVSLFIEKHPTMKILALAFLILIGVMLVAEGMGKHIEKGYIYFAMAFSLGVEFINMRVRRFRRWSFKF
jgi:predicted tellurium resistance membrane protein TerC